MRLLVAQWLAEDLGTHRSQPHCHLRVVRGPDRQPVPIFKCNGLRVKRCAIDAWLESEPRRIDLRQYS